MRTLTVTLEDLEGIPHGTVAAGTTLTVTARYSGPVVLTDGTIVPTFPKRADLPGTGVAAFEVHESDDPAVQADHQGFAVIVEATVTGWASKSATYRRSVKVLTTSPPLGGAVPLGSLPAAEPLPREWATVAEVTSGFDARLDVLETAPRVAQDPATGRLYWTGV